MGDNRLLIAGVVMTIIGVCLVGVIIYATMRFRRQRDEHSLPIGRRATIVDRSHLASKITPFATRDLNPAGQEPRFLHAPGKHMRIATRRPDGAWLFSSPSGQFSPSGIDDMAPSPTRSYFAPSITSSVSSTSKKSYGKSGLGLEYDFDLPPDVLPPPAYVYGHDSPGYTGQYDHSPQFPPRAA